VKKFNFYESLLNKIINEIIPSSVKAINVGNKVFGAAIIKKSDLSTLVIGTNNEIINPLFHGEISTINKFFSDRHILKIDPKDCIFITTHEPCSLCLSAITWSGFDNFYYFFPYKDTKNTFNIPHDLKILSEIFSIEDGNYNKFNNYWKSYSIIDEIIKLDKKEKVSIKPKIDFIINKYKELSRQYQISKSTNNIPLN